jgi:membrane fusion protein (multidrug efflux system)
VNRRKKYVIAIAAIILIGASWMKFHHKKASFQPDVTMVEVERVKYANIPVKVQAVGALVAAQSVRIAPETAGQVTKILFQDGMFVKKGTPLIQLNDAIYKTKLDSAKADYSLSKTTYGRIAELAKKGIISRQDAEKSLADLKEKKASAEESQAMLDKMLIVAPFDGVVGKSLVSPGNYVSTGQELVTLTDTHHLHVEYNVSENSLAMLKLGQAVKITTSTFPDKEFTGTVAYMAPTINTQDRTISLYAEVPNEDQKLVAGLFVNVEQTLGEQTNALMVPATSLLATIDGQQVYTVTGGKAHAVAVSVGQHTDNNVQILKGLSVGDSVVVAGQQKIHDGADVKVAAKA